MTQKICKHCHQPKDKTEFSKHSGFKDGLHSSCKRCESTRSRERARARTEIRDTSDVSHKVCSACKIEKPLTDFSRDKTKKLGVTSSCKPCSLDRYNRWCQSNPDRAKEIQTQASKRRRRARSSYFTFWMDATGYDRNAFSKRYRHEKAAELSLKAAARRQTLEHKIWKRHESSRRRQRFKYSSPAWVDRSAIIEFYRNCPPGHHVDHIIPLKGRNVSGLHVVENLQYLTKVENLKKGNRFHVHPF